MNTHISVLPDPVLVDLPDSTVATYVLEPEGGDPRGDVVFCHGTPWSALAWADAARSLSGAYRAFLWDMPGYGRSIGNPDAAVDLRSQMERLSALVDHWGLDRPHLVAHDIGGAAALGAHLLEGVDAASLALFDVVTLDPWGSPFFRLVADHEAVFAALPPDLHAALVRAYIAGAAREALPPAWLEALAEPWLGAAGRAAFYRQIAQLRAEHTRPVADALSAVRCPVMIGWGDDDPWLPVDQAAALAQLLPGDAPVVTWPGAGHLVPVERPAAVSRTLGDWLTHLS